MRHTCIFATLLAITLLSCRNLGQSKNAMRAANQALFLYRIHGNNPDSINLALYLLDSLNKLHPYPTFYIYKYQILRETNRPLDALLACDSALLLDKHNYTAILGKGYTLEVIGKSDSALYYYRAALPLLDSPNYFRAPEIARDQQRIILKGLLGDTIAFKQSLTKFIAKYQDTAGDLYNV